MAGGSLARPQFLFELSKCLQVIELILSELERLKTEGFTSSAIEAAVNGIEFDLRENNTGRFPRGLSLMLRSMSSWIYDKDPFQPLQWTEPLENFKVSCIYVQMSNVGCYSSWQTSLEQAHWLPTKSCCKLLDTLLQFELAWASSLRASAGMAMTA